MKVCNTPSDLSEHHVIHWRGIRTDLILLTKHMKSLHYSLPQKSNTEPLHVASGRDWIHTKHWTVVITIEMKLL
jgi:hypothetical protein